MKPIIVLIAVAIAGAGLGVGFLNAPSIEVVSQDVGVGHDTLTAPVDTAWVGFHITAIAGNQGFFKNQYDACIVKVDQYLDPGAIIFCKLTDMAGNIVAEGKTVIGGSGLSPFDTVTIKPLTKISTGSLMVNNIQDVTIVIQDAIMPSGN